jgi:hypothetical protein
MIMRCHHRMMKGYQHNTTSLETKNMCRFTVALVIFIASAAVSWAQSPSIWKSQQGAILKVLSTDAATGNFSGIFISSPTSPCPGVSHDLAGQVRGHQVVFQTSRTGTSDCALTVVWYGRANSPGTVSTRWVVKSAAPNGAAVTRRGTEVFQRV